MLSLVLILVWAQVIKAAWAVRMRPFYCDPFGGKGLNNKSSIGVQIILRVNQSFDHEALEPWSYHEGDLKNPKLYHIIL